MVRTGWVALAVGCAGQVTDDPVLEALRAPPEGSQRYGGFEGHTPCDDPCEKLKVGLTLHEDAADQTPTTFVLEQIFVADGNTRHVSEGTWAYEAAPTWFPEAVVFRMVDDPAPTSTLPDESDRIPTPPDFTAPWLVLRDNVLVLLDEAFEPRVGDGSESWTLDRTE